MQVANLNKRALVVGLGVSGIAAARLLCAQGFQVAVSDRRSTTELKDVIGELRQLGINEIETSGHSEALFLNQNLIIVSPGVPLSLPIFTKARAYGCEIIGEVELAARSSNLPMLALTGTNGKTTTVSLLGEVFQAAGVKAFVGGNLGRPAVEMVESGNDIAILELSSFQLEGVASFRPRIAVILNLTPDHQDRYSDSAAYLAAKVRISKTQEGVDFLVLNYDDPKLRVLGAELMARRQAGGDLPQVLFFSVEEKFVEKGGSWINGRIVIKTKTLSGHNLDLDFRAPTVKLPGAHNRSNYLAALLTALIYGLDEKSSIDTLSSFLGIPHRLEFVGSKAGVDYYNDSKATNIDAVVKAVGSFEKPILLLLGGYDKGADFSLLDKHLKKNLRSLIPFGQAAAEVAKQLSGFDQGFRAQNLEAALQQAVATAKPGDVVLLAPGCASFDEFANYEERGDRFRELVLSFRD